MIGYYPYVIGALLLIYPHSTSQTFYNGKLERIKDLLREEKSESDSSPVEIVCEKLVKEEKELLCAKAMELMIFLEHDIDDPRAESFIEKKSRHPVPQLAKSENPFMCKPIPIEELDMTKNMFWCEHKVWREEVSDEIHAQGFFISSGRQVLDSVFIFRPLAPDSDAVVPVVVMEQVDLLTAKAQECSSSCGEN